MNLIINGKSFQLYLVLNNFDADFERSNTARTETCWTKTYRIQYVNPVRAYDQYPRDKVLEHGPEVINSNCVEKVTQLKE